MPLAFLLDEHLRGPLWNAIERHNLISTDRIDAVRVGDVIDLPLGIDDTGLLRWAQREERLLVTEDKHTMPSQLRELLREGGHSPGVLIVRAGSSWSEVVDCLVLVAHAGLVVEFRDAVTFIP